MLDVGRLRVIAVIRTTYALLFYLGISVAISSCDVGRNAEPAFNGTRGPCVVEFSEGPLLVIIGANPWQVMLGERNPSFVLYADGTVVYSRSISDGETFFTGRLTDCELNGLLEQLTLSNLYALDGRRYSAALATDQTLTSFMLRKPDGSFCTIAVYGWETDWQTKQQSAAVPQPPPELDSALRLLADFSFPNAAMFEPAAFRVFLSDGCAGGNPTPKKWPATWPDSSTATSIDSGPWRAMTLSAVTSREVSDTLGPSNLFRWRCVAIGNRREAVMYRPMFPFESRWTREDSLSEDSTPSTAPN